MRTALGAFFIIVLSMTSHAQKIPGVTAEDVYHKMDQRGMRLWQGWEAGKYVWKLNMVYGDIDYYVLIRSDDSLSVEEAYARVKADSIRTDVLDTQQFLRIVAATPYDGSNPELVEKWITENYEKPESRIIIGTVEYILRAPSPYRRELEMNPVKQ